jgi:NAD(P)H-dependent flavin oxidoreductase YrpB (nitropropane dioxygenase family)
MKLGASGVQMGTRFITSHECDASQGLNKHTLIQLKKILKL